MAAIKLVIGLTILLTAMLGGWSRRDRIDLGLCAVVLLLSARIDTKADKDVAP